MIDYKFIAIAAVAASGASFSNSVLATCQTNCYTTYYNDVTETPELTVNQQAIDMGNGKWQYSFEIVPSYTGGPFVVSGFTLPLFLDSDISELRVTQGGGYLDLRVEDSAYENAPRSLTLYNSGPPPFGMQPVAGAFSFLSSFAPDAQSTASLRLSGLSSQSTSYQFGETVTVITRGIAPSTPFLYAVNMPGSPMAMAAQVPEPTSLTMLLMGLLGIYTITCHRQRSV